MGVLVTGLLFAGAMLLVTGAMFALTLAGGRWLGLVVASLGPLVGALVGFGALKGVLGAVVGGLAGFWIQRALRPRDAQPRRARVRKATDDVPAGPDGAPRGRIDDVRLSSADGRVRVDVDVTLEGLTGIPCEVYLQLGGHDAAFNVRPRGPEQSFRGIRFNVQAPRASVAAKVAMRVELRAPDGTVLATHAQQLAVEPELRPHVVDRIRLMVAAALADGALSRVEVRVFRRVFEQELGVPEEQAHLVRDAIKQARDGGVDTPGVCARVRARGPREVEETLRAVLLVAAADGPPTNAQRVFVDAVARRLDVVESRLREMASLYWEARARPAEPVPEAAASDDCWRVLGVAPGSDRRDIRAAYRKLAKDFHPDRVSHLGEAHQREAHARFLALQSAYEEAMRRHK